MVSHQDSISSGWSFGRVVSHEGGRSSWWCLIRLVCHQVGLSSGWSLIRVVSHQGGLSSGWSINTIRVVAHQGGLSSRWSLIMVSTVPPKTKGKGDYSLSLLTHSVFKIDIKSTGYIRFLNSEFSRRASLPFGQNHF